VERLLYDRDLAVRTEALLYVAHQARIDPLERIEQLGNFADFSIRSAMVSFLAHPGPTRTSRPRDCSSSRWCATPTCGRGSRPRGCSTCCRRRSTTSSHAAHRPPPRGAPARAAGSRPVGKRRFLPLVVHSLAVDGLTDDAIEALRLYGERVVGTLERHLESPDTPRGASRDSRRAAGDRRSGRRAGAHGEPARRRHGAAVPGADRPQQAAGDEPLGAVDTQLVETVLAAEIMGHLRSYQILGTLGDPARLDPNDPMAQAVRDSMNQEVERIFRLVKLLDQSVDLHSAYVGLQASDRAVHDNALEFLEHVLRPQLRALLVPLVDSDVTIARRVALANEVLGTTIQSREEAVSLLALSPDPWLQSCAAYAIGILRLASLRPELDRWLTADDPCSAKPHARPAAKLDAAGGQGPRLKGSMGG
jgi:hypothetical protein